MATNIWINISSSNDLLPDGTKPLTELILTEHHWGLVALFWGQFHRKCSRYLFLIWVWNSLILDYSHISMLSTSIGGQWYRWLLPCDPPASFTNNFFKFRIIILKIAVLVPYQNHWLLKFLGTTLHFQGGNMGNELNRLHMHSYFMFTCYVVITGWSWVVFHAWH